MRRTARAYPHKEIHGASLEDRLEMLRRAASRYRVEVTEGGLFIDIARELRRRAPGADIYFICGRDAAERIVTWDYDDPGVAERMFDEFHLLVASREGAYVPPEHLRHRKHLRHRIHPLVLPCGLDQVSSTEVRRRIAEGERWEYLVPESIIDLIKRIYR